MSDITLGTKVAYYDRDSRKVKICTVRAHGKEDRADHVRIDDGDPADADLHTNGFRFSAWVRARDVTVVR